jgi:hypothetical protein
MRLAGIVSNKTAAADLVLSQYLFSQLTSKNKLEKFLPGNNPLFYILSFYRVVVLHQELIKGSAHKTSTTNFRTMDSNCTRQEILLMINTSFSNRAWARITETEQDRKLSNKEQLMEACWNGLTPQMLPECFGNIYDQIVSLWGITDANHFIDLEFGEFVQKKDIHHSVNPYAFLQVQGYN